MSRYGPDKINVGRHTGGVGDQFRLAGRDNRFVLSGRNGSSELVLKKTFPLGYRSVCCLCPEGSERTPGDEHSQQDDVFGR